MTVDNYFRACPVKDYYDIFYIKKTGLAGMIDLFHG